MDRPPIPAQADLLKDLRALIESARGRVARSVNSATVALYWSVGDRLRREVLGEKRAAYGKRIVATVSQQLAAEYGQGFSYTALTRMMKVAERFPDQKIVASLMQQLTWTHFLLLTPIKDPQKREYYAEMCRVEKWNFRTLRAKIKGMLYERTALSKKPAELVQKELQALRKDDVMSPDMVFQDPYVLDFLRLKGAYLEKDLEQAILREMESIILELGAGFAFVERQKRISVGSEDFHLDLLFYNRNLRRLVAVELKLGRFRPEYKGQMELYLRWLDKHERRAGELAPYGLILCSEKCEEQVELLELDKSGIRVAEYLTELPPRRTLEAKLHAAISAAKRRLAPPGGPGF
jgi:predicted nuclease of restriction endonuclease-like (RecB) superfamily